MSWHIARFMSGWEERAARALDDPLGDIHDVNNGGRAAFCPLERYVWVSHGKKREAVRPVLGGCVFVEGARDPVRWHDIAETEGFIGFLGARQDYPEPVKMGDVLDDEGEVLRMGIASWRAMAGPTWLVDFDDCSVTEDPLERGDVVRLRSLAEAADTHIDVYRAVELARLVFPNPETTGIVEWVQGDGTAWVTFRGLFNQETKISISARALERVRVESKRQRARLSVVR